MGPPSSQGATFPKNRRFTRKSAADRCSRLPASTETMLRKALEEEQSNYQMSPQLWDVFHDVILWRWYPAGTEYDWNRVESCQVEQNGTETGLSKSTSNLFD